MISWQTWALATALISVGLCGWWLLQPPSADTLYGRITAHTADETTASILQAEDDIREFIERYPNDPRGGRFREYEKEIDLYRLERKFDKRVRGLAGAESLLPVERAYLDAINYVRLEPERGMAKLEALIELYRQQDDGSGPTGRCLILARRRLTQICKDIDEHSRDQLALLLERIDAADALRSADPERARAMYRAAVELYSEKPWAAAAVRRAQESLSQGEASPAPKNPSP